MRKTAVVVTPCPSHPTTAGNRARVYEMGRRLREYGFRVVLIHYNLERVTDAAHQSMRAYWDEYHVIEVSEDLRRNDHIDPEAFASVELRNTVNRVCRDTQASLLLVNYVWMAGVLDAVTSNVLKVLDVHDRFGCRHELLRLMGAEPSWFTLSPHREAICANKADVIWCVSRQETDYFRQLVDRPVYYMGHPIKASFIERRTYQLSPKFLFFGSYNAVNQQSLKYIERAAIALEGKAEFLVGGSVCHLLSRAAPNISTLEYIRDIGEYFEAGWISINPVFVGTGNKIKTIDSLRYGAPIVSGRAGFDGVDTDEAMHHLADEHAFMDALQKIVRGEVSIEGLATASRRVFLAFEKTARQAFEEFLEAYFSAGERKLPPQPSVAVATVDLSKDQPAPDLTPADWDKGDFVRLAYDAFSAGLQDLGLAAATASLALDPISANLNLLRAFAAFSLGHHDEAGDAWATYDWLIRRGALDYAPPPHIAGGSALFAASDAPSILNTMTLIGEAIAPMVTHEIRPLPLQSADNLDLLLAHLKMANAPIGLVNAPVLLPSVRGSQADKAKNADTFDARLFMSASAFGGYRRALVIEALQPGNVDGCTLTLGDDVFELVQHSAGRFTLPVQALSGSVDEHGAMFDLKVRGRVTNGDFDRFWEDIRVSLVDETTPVPTLLARYIGKGVGVCQLRNIELGPELRGSGWHNADRLESGSFGRWTRKNFSIVQPSLGRTRMRFFLELVATRKEPFEADLVHAVKSEGRPLDFQVVDTDGTSVLWAELDPDTVARPAWEVEITATDDERLAGDMDSRMICLYVTGIRIWGLVQPSTNEIDILMSSPGAPTELHANYPADYTLPGFRSSPGALVLELADEERTELAKLAAGDFALEWNDKLLPASKDSGPRFLFPVSDALDFSAGARLRLYPPTPVDGDRTPLQIRSFEFLAGVAAPDQRVHSSRQDRYWDSFHSPEMFIAGTGRWMSRRGTLRFTASEPSVLKLYLFIERDLYAQGKIAAFLDGIEIPFLREPWTVGQSKLIFDIPAAPGERRLVVVADDCFVPGEGDMRELSILAHCFTVAPPHAAYELIGPAPEEADVEALQPPSEPKKTSGRVSRKRPAPSKSAAGAR